MLIYKRACVEIKVDLTPLEGEGYDPNEPDLEPFDDSAPLDQAELEDKTAQLHPSDQETDEVVSPPLANETAPVATVELPPTPADPPQTPADPVPPSTYLSKDSGTEQQPPGTKAKVDQHDPPAT